MISAVVLTKDSEDTLDKCLKSIFWCDEIIVIDDNSSDKTLNIAEKHKAKIYKHKLNNNFAAQRNYGLSKVKHEWILFLDSDEVATRELGREIRNTLQNTKYSGFYIERSDYWLGKQLNRGESGSNYIVRLGKRNKGVWKRKVHETWEINGRVGKMNNKITHYPHPTMYDFIDQVSFHSNLHASQNDIEHKKSSIYKISMYPLFKFLNNFIIKRGYQDGTHGFVAAIIMSFHSFLAWSQLWLSQKE